MAVNARIKAFRGSLALTTLLLFGGCADPSGPVETEPQASQPQIEKLRPMPSAPELETYDTTVVVIQGEQAAVTLPYAEDSLTGGPNKDSWFLQLTLPADAQYVDSAGSFHALGDTVEVHLQVERDAFGVHLDPHGTVFPTPAVLSFNFRHADVSGKDLDLLRLWYQPHTGYPWAPQPVELDRKGFTISAELAHFSNYALAW